MYKWLVGGLLLLSACRPAVAQTVLPTVAVVAVVPPTPSHTPTLPPTNTPLPTIGPPTATPTHTPTPTETATATPIPATPTPGINIALPKLWLVPGLPQGYLDQFRLVAFYGSPAGPGLGILGNQPREETLALLRARALEYLPYSPERIIIPTYHLIVTTASPNPPAYSTEISLAVLEEWIAAAEASGTAVILDIQPGRVSVWYEYSRIRALLYHPHVHLALDPEFNMNSEQVPSVNLGQMSAAEINQVQADLNEIGREIGLNRVLILHQFADRMLPNKEAIAAYPFVEVVIDGDGVGSAAAKLRNYNQYAQEPAFEYGGFKLFPNDGDSPLLTPSEVMTLLEPPPVLIIYQ